MEQITESPVIVHKVLYWQQVATCLVALFGMDGEAAIMHVKNYYQQVENPPEPGGELFFYNTEVFYVARRIANRMDVSPDDIEHFEEVYPLILGYYTLPFETDEIAVRVVEFAQFLTDSNIQANVVAQAFGIHIWTDLPGEYEVYTNALRDKVNTRTQ